MNELDKLIKYESVDGKVLFVVNLDEETVWLTQKQMAELFERGIPAINEHIKNIFEENEFDEQVVIRKFRNTTQHGAVKGKTQTKNDHKRSLYALKCLFGLILGYI